MKCPKFATKSLINLKQMNIFKLFLPITISFLVILGSCNDNQSEQPTGEISLSVIQKAIKSGRIEVDENPVSISITIKKGNETILDSKEYDISQFGSGFLIDPIVLEIGEYTIEEFLVYNTSNEVIFATPKTGSQFEKFVDTPLPTSFTISADVVSELSLEVISTEGIDPEDLGYASIGFNILPVKNILVSVFSQSETNNLFIESELTIYGDNDSINTVSLGDSINVVKVKSDFDNLRFEFNATGFAAKTIALSSSELSNYLTTPLEVILTNQADVDLENGLIGYYKLDNNANDSGTNGIDGVLGDGSGNNVPSVTTDRNGNPNAAFEFDGTIKYVDLTENPVFDLGDYEEFSISVWVDPNLEIEQDQGGFIVGKHISASNNRMWNLRILNNKFDFRLYDQGGSSISNSIQGDILEGWQHVVGVVRDGMMILYVNGVEVSSTPKTVSVKADSPTAKTVIGAAHFSNSLFDINFAGKIDDLRLYNRALNTSEITVLANE